MKNKNYKATGARKNAAKKGNGEGVKRSGSNLLEEFLGLLFFALAILLVISVYADKSGSASLSGSFGKALSAFLFDNFGFGAYAFCAAFVLLGLALLLRRPKAALLRAAIGWSGIILGISALCEHWGIFEKGGAVGRAFAPPLNEAFGGAGTSVVVCAALLFFVALSTTVSPVRIILLIGGAILRVVWFIAKALGIKMKDAAAAAIEKTGDRIKDGIAAKQESRRAARLAGGTRKERKDEEEEASGSLAERPNGAAKGKRNKFEPIIHNQETAAAAKGSCANDSQTAAPDWEIKEPSVFQDTVNRINMKDKDAQAAKNESQTSESNDGDYEASDTVAEAKASDSFDAIGGEVDVSAPGAAPKYAEKSEKAEPPAPRPRQPKPQLEPIIKEHKIDDGFDPNAPAGAIAKVSEPRKPYELPPLDILEYVPSDRPVQPQDELKENAKHLEETLKDYGIEGQITEIHPGPLITMYEFRPNRGIKISKISSLQDDLAMALAAFSVRIVAPIPGKSVVGIEVPNRMKQTVYLKEIIAHPTFRDAKGALVLAMGKDIFGYPVVSDLARMPHLLMAGTTGSGKSVALNAMILSLLYRFNPDDMKFLLIDPKRLEFSFYEDIPHLLLPVVTDAKKAVAALRWAVGEMERRYQLMKEMGVKQISTFNQKVEKMLEDAKRNEEMRRIQSVPKSGAIIFEREGGSASGESEDIVEELRRAELIADNVPPKMPYIVIIIDELADLMMQVGKDAEIAIARLAQLARASGIHLIVATQRPSTDVITGLIKNNFPCRVSFKVGDKVSSRVVLDVNGAEALLGVGDMLFMAPGMSGLQRVHAPYLSEDEINRVVKFVKGQAEPDYAIDLDALMAQASEGCDIYAPAEDDLANDELYDQAIQIVCETGQASASYLQRRLKIGYTRAARMVDKREKDGSGGPADGAKPRKVFGRPLGGYGDSRDDEY